MRLRSIYSILTEPDGKDIEAAASVLENEETHFYPFQMRRVYIKYATSIRIIACVYFIEIRTEREESFSNFKRDGGFEMLGSVIFFFLIEL